MHRVVVHGHLYQPPREDPWTGEVPAEGGAEPFHDWNERITSESYRPNIANYRGVSFDLGPTLALWLEEHAPDVLAALVAADGHGRRALAHPWVHAILPLCSERDLRTLVRWGVDDFRHRFGREPEGLWLPETAVDTASLEAMADAGMWFTILAPHQIAREDGSEVDPSVAHRIELPSGRAIGVLAYDGALANEVAFHGLLRDGVGFAHRLVAAREQRPDGVTAVATDFETFGHHHAFGDMALASALTELEAMDDVEVVSAVEALERIPSEPARLVEPSSWSCVHGIERWRSDCGCRAHDATPLGQAWRTPLRDGLDWLRDTVAGLESLTVGLDDPWASRDAYLSAGVSHPWLELQKHLLLQYSSCGWFFDDAAGHETVIVLKHAARAVELVRALDGPDLEPELVDRLRPMASEEPGLEDGEAIWRERVVATSSGC